MRDSDGRSLLAIGALLLAAVAFGAFLPAGPVAPSPLSAEQGGAEAPADPSAPPPFERIAEEFDCSKPGAGYQPCGSYRSTVTVVHGDASCGGFVYENAPDSTGAVWFEVVAVADDSRPDDVRFEWTGFQEPTLGAAIIAAASLPAGVGVDQAVCRQGLKFRQEQ